MTIGRAVLLVGMFAATVWTAPDFHPSQTAEASLSSASNSPLSIPTASVLHLGYLKRVYRAVAKTEGATPPLSWSISSGTLPPGLSLKPASGAIGGTPTQGGSYSFIATVTDSNGRTAFKNFSLQVVEQPLDEYGGLINKPSSNGATGYFRAEKFKSRWMFVTPAGNAFWMIAVFDLDGSDSIHDDGSSYNQIVATKYADKGTWANQMLNRAESWGFNSVGEYASTYAYPFNRPPGATLVPINVVNNDAHYGLTNRNHWSPHGAFKDLIDCQNRAVYTGWAGGSTPDVYDPNFDAFVNGHYQATQADPFYKQLLTSPWSIGLTSDDTDYLTGFGPGLEVPAPNGAIHPHIGWLSLAASPTKASSAKWRQTYSNETVFSKQQLQAYLEGVYRTIGELNTVWGSNYTTFGSAGGWPKTTTGGTGLMDEDGSSSWLGNHNGSLSGATPGVTTDLDAFLLQWARKYFQVTATRFRQYSPHHLFFGPSTLNSHNGLTRKQILQAAGQYCDVVQAGVTTQQLLDKTAQYVGDKPIVQWLGATANADSSLWRHVPGPSCCDQANQEARGSYYSNLASFLVNGTVTATGSQPIVGLKWWAWADSWGEKANWGLVSFRDNAYDGEEAIIAAGADSWGYRTGGEVRNYGNFLTAVTQENLKILRTLAALP